MSRAQDFRYPPVLPIVFYDGKTTWNAETNFAGRTQMNEVFAKYIPGFEYELVDLNRYTLEELTGFGDALSLILAADKVPKGGNAALGELLKEYAGSLQVPENLRKLITDVVTVLFSRVGMAERKIAAITDAIEKKE